MLYRPYDLAALPLCMSNDIFQNGADTTTGGNVMEEMTGMGGMEMMVSMPIPS